MQHKGLSVKGDFVLWNNAKAHPVSSRRAGFAHFASPGSRKLIHIIGQPDWRMPFLWPGKPMLTGPQESGKSLHWSARL